MLYQLSYTPRPECALARREASGKTYTRSKLHSLQSIAGMICALST